MIRGPTTRGAWVVWATIAAALSVASPALARGGGGKAGPKKPPPDKRQPPEPEPPPPPPPEPPKPEPVKIEAPPANKKMVGILDVRVDGVSDDLKAKFEQQLEQQLDTNQYWLANRASMRERMKFSTKWTEGCLIGDCLAEVRTQTSASLVLLAALNGSGTTFGYVVTLVRTDTGRVLAQKADRCDVCTINEAMTQATLATIELLNEIPPQLPDEAAASAAALKSVRADNERDLTKQRHGFRKTGKVLTVTGLIVAAGGVAAYALMDKPAWGLGVAGAGAGILGGGVVVLAF